MEQKTETQERMKIKEKKNTNERRMEEENRKFKKNM